MSDEQIKFKLDAEYKDLLSYDFVLNQIIKECIPEFKNISLEDINNKYLKTNMILGTDTNDKGERRQHIGLNIESKTTTEGDAFFDLLYSVELPQTSNEENNQIGVILHIEEQTKYDTTYPLVSRAVYYSARLLSMQKKWLKSEVYSKIQKVYSIWICVNPLEDDKNTMTRFYINREDIVGANTSFNKGDYDLLEIQFICLDSNISKTSKEKFQGIIDFLSIHLSPQMSNNDKDYVLERDFNVPSLQLQQERVDTMTIYEVAMKKYLKEGKEEGKKIGIEIGKEEGIEIGKEEGIEIGKEEGIEIGKEEGKEEATIKFIRNLFKKGYRTLEDIKEFVPDVSLTLYTKIYQEFNQEEEALKESEKSFQDFFSNCEIQDSHSHEFI